MIGFKEGPAARYEPDRVWISPGSIAGERPSGPSGRFFIVPFYIRRFEKESILRIEGPLVPFEGPDLQCGAKETFDVLLNGRVRIIQPRDGYRVNQDSLRLCQFVRPIPEAKGIDLGAGCGIMAIVLVLEEKVKTMMALELQEKLAAFARQNATLNGLDGRIEVVRGDMRRVEKLFKPHSFGLAVSNPPYRVIGSGRPSPSVEKNIARQEQWCSLEDLVRAAAYLLKANGIFTFCQLKERWGEIEKVLAAHDFHITRREAMGTVVLVEALKQ